MLFKISSSHYIRERKMQSRNKSKSFMPFSVFLPSWPFLLFLYVNYNWHVPRAFASFLKFPLPIILGKERCRVEIKGRVLCLFLFFYLRGLSSSSFMSTTIGTCQEHLPATEHHHQGPWPSACAGAAADLRHSLKGIQWRVKHSVLPGYWWNRSLDS